MNPRTPDPQSAQRFRLVLRHRRQGVRTPAGEKGRESGARPEHGAVPEMRNGGVLAPLNGHERTGAEQPGRNDRSESAGERPDAMHQVHAAAPVLRGDRASEQKHLGGPAGGCAEVDHPCATAAPFAGGGMAGTERVNRKVRLFGKPLDQRTERGDEMPGPLRSGPAGNAKGDPGTTGVHDRIACQGWKPVRGTGKSRAVPPAR